MAKEKLEFLVEVKNIQALSALSARIAQLRDAYNRAWPRAGEAISASSAERLSELARQFNVVSVAQGHLVKQNEMEARTLASAAAAMQVKSRVYQEAASILRNITELEKRYIAASQSLSSTAREEAGLFRRNVAALSEKAGKLLELAQRYGVATSAVDKFGRTLAHAMRGLETGLVSPKDFSAELERQVKLLNDVVTKQARRYTPSLDTRAETQRMAGEVLAASYRRVSREVVEMAEKHYIASRAVSQLSRSMNAAASYAPVVGGLMQYNAQLIASAKAHNIGADSIARFAVQLQRLNSLYRSGAIDGQRYVAGIQAISGKLRSSIEPVLARSEISSAGFWASITHNLTHFLVKLGVGVFVFNRISAGFREISQAALSVVNAYADLVEAQNFFHVAFGKSAQEMRRWVKEVSETLFMNEARLMQTVAQWKLILEDIGMSGEDAIWMAKVFQKIAIDVASLRNADIERVTEAMISGLQGNIRPLRALGIDVSKATLEFYALASGVKQASGELSTFERVMSVAMAVIVATASDRGDFVATMGTTKNQMRILNEQWLLFKQRLGEASGSSIDVARAVNSISIAVRGLHGYVGMVVELFGVFLKVLHGVANLVKGIVVQIVASLDIATKSFVAFTEVMQIWFTKGALGFKEMKAVLADLKSGVEASRKTAKELMDMDVAEVFAAGGIALAGLLGGKTREEIYRDVEAELRIIERLRESLGRTGDEAERLKAILDSYGDEINRIAGASSIEENLMTALRAADEFLQRRYNSPSLLPPMFKSVFEVPAMNLKLALEGLQIMMREWGQYRDRVKRIQEEISALGDDDIQQKIALYRAMEAESRRMADLVGGVFRETALRDAKKAAAEVIQLQRQITNETIQSVEAQLNAIISLMKRGLAPENAANTARNLLAQLEQLYQRTGKSSVEVQAAMADWNEKIEESTNKVKDYSGAFANLKNAVESVISAWKDGRIADADAVAQLRFYQHEFNKLVDVAGRGLSAANEVGDAIRKGLSDVAYRLDISELQGIVDALNIVSNLDKRDQSRLRIARELYAEMTRIISSLREQIDDEERLVKLKEMQEDAAKRLADIERETVVVLENRVSVSEALQSMGQKMGDIFANQLASSFSEAFSGGNVYKALIRSFKSLGVALGKAAAGSVVDFLFGRQFQGKDGKTYSQPGLLGDFGGLSGFWERLSKVERGPMGLSGSQIQGLMMLGTLIQAYGSYKSNRAMSAFGGAVTGFSAYSGLAAAGVFSFNPYVAIIAAVLAAIVGWFAGDGKEKIKYLMRIQGGVAIVDEVTRVTKEEERSIQQQLQSRFDDIRNAWENVLIKLKQKITGLVFKDIVFGTVDSGGTLHSRETYNFQNALQAILQSELPAEMLKQVFPVVSSALQSFGISQTTIQFWKSQFDIGQFDKVMPKFVKFIDLFMSASEAAQKFGRSLEEVIDELERGSMAAWSSDFAEGFAKIQQAVDNVEGASIDVKLDVYGESLQRLTELYDQSVQFLKQLLQIRKQIQETIQNFLDEFTNALTKKESWSRWKDVVISKFNEVLNWLQSPPENVQPEDVQKKVGELMGYARQVDEIIGYIASAVERLGASLDDIANIISELDTDFSGFAAIENGSAAYNFHRQFGEAYNNISRLGEQLKTITDPGEYASTVEQIREHARSAAEALKEFGRAIINAERSIRDSIQAMLEDITLSEFDASGDVVGKGSYLIEQMKKYREMIATASSPEEVQSLIESILKYANMLRGMGDQILLEYEGQQMTVDQWLKLLLPQLQSESDAALQRFKAEWEQQRNVLKDQLTGLSDDIATARSRWQTEMDSLIELLRSGLEQASTNATNILNGFIDEVGKAIEQINNLNNALINLLKTIGGGSQSEQPTEPPVDGEPPPEEPPGSRPRIPPVDEAFGWLSGAAVDVTSSFTDVALAARDFARTLNAINGNVQITLVVDPAILVDVDGRNDLVRVARRS